MSNMGGAAHAQNPIYSVGKPIPGNVPVRAPEDTKQSPYWFIGKLRMTFPNGKSYLGTGTLIAAKSKDKTGLYVLTCAHNLYDASDGGKATGVTFQRGLNGQKVPPYPVTAASDWYYPAGYPDHAIPRNVDPAHLGAALLEAHRELDYGLVKLSSKIDVQDCPVMTALTDKELGNLAVSLIGLYGWNDEDNNMYVGSGNIEIVEPTEVGYPISTNVGSSGTAVQASAGRVVAVHTHSGAGGDEHNYGRRLTTGVIAEIAGWQ